MADEVIPTIPTADAGSGSVASPSVSPEPAAIPLASPAPVETPAVAAPAEPVVEKPADPAPTHEPTLVEKFIAERDAKKAGEAKPADPAAAATEKPVEPAKDAAAAKPGEEPKPVDPAAPTDPAAAADAPAPFDPKVHEFELPPTLQAKSPQMDEFRGLLAERDTLPPAEFAQRLVNLHAQAAQEFADGYVKKVSEDQWKVWNDSQQKLQTEVMADPLIGGNNFGGAMEKIAKFRDTFVPEKEMAEFDQALRLSGAGNMAPILRALYRAQSRFDEPRMPPDNPRPPKDIGQRPNTRPGLKGMYKSANGTA